MKGSESKQSIASISSKIIIHTYRHDRAPTCQSDLCFSHSLTLLSSFGIVGCARSSHFSPSRAAQSIQERWHFRMPSELVANNFDASRSISSQYYESPLIPAFAYTQQICRDRTLSLLMSIAIAVEWTLSRCLHKQLLSI